MRESCLLAFNLQPAELGHTVSFTNSGLSANTASLEWWIHVRTLAATLPNSPTLTNATNAKCSHSLCLFLFRECQVFAQVALSTRVIVYGRKSCISYIHVIPLQILQYGKQHIFYCNQAEW